MKKIFRIFSAICMFPTLFIVWAFIILPGLFLGAIRFTGRQEFLIARFVVNFKTRYKFCTKIINWWLNRYLGWAAPCAIIISPHALQDTIKHEIRHCKQIFLFGNLFYPLYGLFYLVCVIIGKHSYYSNPFEKDARKNAGQMY